MSGKRTFGNANITNSDSFESEIKKQKTSTESINTYVFGDGLGVPNKTDVEMLSSENEHFKKSNEASVLMCQKLRNVIDLIRMLTNFRNNENLSIETSTVDMFIDELHEYYEEHYYEDMYKEFSDDISLVRQEKVFRKYYFKIIILGKILSYKQNIVIKIMKDIEDYCYEEYIDDLIEEITDEYKSIKECRNIFRKFLCEVKYGEDSDDMDD